MALGLASSRRLGVTNQVEVRLGSSDSLALICTNKVIEALFDLWAKNILGGSKVRSKIRLGEVFRKNAIICRGVQNILYW